MSFKILKILFCPFPGYGCINPLIGIAQKLYRRGHRIIFSTEEKYKQKLINNGFEVILLTDDEEEISIDTFAKNLYESGYYDTTASPLEKMKSFVKDRSPLICLKSGNFSMKLKEILNNIEVNIIVTTHNVAPSIMKSEYPWIFVGTANPLNYLFDERTPPIFSGLPLYDSSEWSDFHNEIIRVLRAVKDMYDKLLITEGLSPIADNRLIYCESPFLNIYSMPKELDYTHIRPLPKNWIQFDGFMRTENEEFNIPKDLTHESGKLIYFTMGTMASINVQMMTRIIDILKDTPHRYIVSKGPLSDTYNLPENMCGDLMVSQTKVLPLVDMVIFHGGHNTLVEAFYFGIPMIIMPLGFDAFSNAERVVEEGFGIKLDPMNCTKEELINGIDYILNNNELTKRIKVVSQRIQSEDKTNELVNEIEAIAYKSIV